MSGINITKLQGATREQLKDSEWLYNNVFRGLQDDYAGNVDLDNLNAWQAFQNYFTGNYTYQREKQLQDRSNAFSLQAMREQQSEARDLANTEVQRRVADASAAGLNPYELVGGGASSPVVSAPSSATAHASSSNGFGALAVMLASAVSSAFSLAKTSMNNNSRLQLEQIKGENAYAAAMARRYNVRQQYFDRSGMLRGTIIRDYN